MNRPLISSVDPSSLYSEITQVIGNIITGLPDQVNKTIECLRLFPPTELANGDILSRVNPWKFHFLQKYWRSIINVNGKPDKGAERKR
jgi:hypothetical protein